MKNEATTDWLTSVGGLAKISSLFYGFCINVSILLKDELHSRMFRLSWRQIWRFDPTKSGRVAHCAASCRRDVEGGDQGLDKPAAKVYDCRSRTMGREVPLNIEQEMLRFRRSVRFSVNAAWVIPLFIMFFF